MGKAKGGAVFRFCRSDRRACRGCGRVGDAEQRPCGSRSRVSEGPQTVHGREAGYQRLREPCSVRVASLLGYVHDREADYPRLRRGRVAA